MGVDRRRVGVRVAGFLAELLVWGKPYGERGGIELCIGDEERDVDQNMFPPPLPSNAYGRTRPYGVREGGRGKGRKGPSGWVVNHAARG